MTPKYVLDRIPKMSTNNRLVLSATLADFLFPILEQLAIPETVNLVLELREAVWSRIAGETNQFDPLNGIARLDATTERHASDPMTRSHFAMSAMSALAYTIHSMVEKSEEYTRHCLSASSNLCRSIDLRLIQEKRPTIHGPNGCEDSRLLLLKLVLDEIESSLPNSQIAQKARQLSEAYGKSVHDAAVELRAVLI